MGGKRGAATCSGDDCLSIQLSCITSWLESDPISVYAFATKECQHISEDLMVAKLKTMMTKTN
jgi:hypothetical protein